MPSAIFDTDNRIGIKTVKPRKGGRPSELASHMYRMPGMAVYHSKDSDGLPRPVWYLYDVRRVDARSTIPLYRIDRRSSRKGDKYVLTDLRTGKVVCRSNRLLAAAQFAYEWIFKE